MQLTFLGTTSSDGNCPTLYVTDRGTLVVQGYRITDPGAVAQLQDLLPGETAVEIPSELLHFAPAGEADGRPEP
ncbi:hypothetical protein [Peterkaempfera griseoplana]|uniref:hypothetical protein n=1 Tax=Peterkaempfera griseoplana TaxID=66896 RepID=UPI0006E46D48|nr:hypothetical protein [Peterkaempfera griseoplana]